MTVYVGLMRALPALKSMELFATEEVLSDGDSGVASGYLILSIIYGDLTFVGRFRFVGQAAGGAGELSPRLLGRSLSGCRLPR